MTRLALATALSVVGIAVTSSSAMNIAIDYTHDAGGYFAADPVARATLERAAADLSAMITTSLTATHDTDTGVGQTTTATFDHEFAFRNPSNAAQTVIIDNAALPADAFRVYVGRQNLTGSAFATGAPASPGFFMSWTGPSDQLQDSVTAASAASTANLRRGGGGPTMLTINDRIDFRVGPDPTFSLAYGATLAALSFDSDLNDDGLTDSAAQIAAAVQTDYTKPVGANQIDLYSVALRELLRAVGVGTSESWAGNVAGSAWNGANVRALLGDEAADALLNGELAPASGASTTLDSNTPQLAAILSAIGTGERRYLTALDAAFLRDIGWDVAVVPEPTTLAAFAAIGATLGLRRRQPSRGR